MANPDQARLIAQRIAQRVEGGNTTAPSPRFSDTDLSSELSAVRATLSELQNRLISIEAKVGNGVTSGGPKMHSPWLAGLNEFHPSQDRFGVEEATIAELVDYFQGEKACSMEPGKPCDHCSMCSSRGF